MNQSAISLVIATGLVSAVIFGYLGYTRGIKRDSKLEGNDMGYMELEIKNKEKALKRYYRRLRKREMFKMANYPLKKSARQTSYKIYKNSGKPLSQALVSLRNIYGAIEDQGDEGSCSAFSSLQFRGALRKQAGLSWINPSQQAQYYEERKLENTINEDSGATLEDALLVMEKYGVMPEKDDHYTPDDFTVNPPAKDWNTSLKLNPKQVQKVNPDSVLADTLDALASGHPVLFGFLVFRDLESKQVARTGILPMPSPYSRELGGHAVNAIGYDPSTEMLLILNQWGEDWGILSPGYFQGCFWMPYEYYSRYCMDAYVGFPDATSKVVLKCPILNRL